MSKLEVEYRVLKSMEEMALVKELDRKIWAMDPVPEHQTITAVKNGGMMLGAFHQGKLIGFSYSFPGFREGQVYLCSHMLGIDPAYQSRGIGEEMKWKQREIALEMGFDVIKWTFDPLETKNGKLNLTKLNGICHTYIENCYGEMTDKLNRGLPSDRFEVHWYIKSPHVAEKHKTSFSEAISLNTIAWNSQGNPLHARKNDVREEEAMYCFHVPRNFQQLKAEDKELALQWRLESRHFFQDLFQKGFTATHVEVEEKMSIYYFMKKSLLQIEGAS